MSVNTTETITLLLEQILHNVHPLMAEALYLAAIPNWYGETLFAAMRQRTDGREAGLIERLNRYSFITPLPEEGDQEPQYTVRPEERIFLQRHWIAKDAVAYRAAHKQALAYWETQTTMNPYAQAQNVFYHRLFVNLPAAMEELIWLFRVYRNDRQLGVIQQLLETAVSARFYLLSLNQDLTEFDALLTHLRALQDQLRGRWAESRTTLETLRQQPHLSPRLQPYVARAYGNALAHTGQFVEAIAEYNQALSLFDQHATAVLSTHDNLQAERAFTLINLGDAHVGLAIAARGYDEKHVSRHGIQAWSSHFFSFFLSLSIALYLSRYLGRRVWAPGFWPALHNLDWMIARLFALGARHYRTADTLLETHGTPAEGVAADERMASLLLAMGDTRQAERIYASLVQETDTPLSEYRRAAVSVGLGEALWRQERREQARGYLETAVPILQRYADQELEAQAELLLAQTLPLSESLPRYGRALTLYQTLNRPSSATDVSERLSILARHPDLPAAQQAAAQQLADSLPVRRYRVRYRHHITSLFQRITIALLLFFLFLIPITIFRLETGSSIMPQISFNATPLLQADNPNFTPDLSQGVSALNLAPTPNPDVIIWLGVLMFTSYIALSSGAGLLVITRTSLAKVQATGEAELLEISAEGISVGSQEQRRFIPWTAVSHFFQATVRVYNDLMIDNAIAVIFAPGHEPIRVAGQTAWFDSVRQHMAQAAPGSAQRTDLSYRLLKSRLGVLYSLTLLALFALVLLGRVAPAIVASHFFGLPYTLADLYPYFYLGLFGPTMWWFVLRPLHIRWHTHPHSQMPQWIGLLGLIIGGLRLLTLFRPWLTVPDIYPSLAVLLLLGGATLSIWQARHENKFAHSLAMRGSTAVLALLACLIMGSHLLREITAYHFLVLGNAHRNTALSLPNSDAKEIEVKKAIAAYSQAIAIEQRPILGITGRMGLTRFPGIPRPIQTTWLAALNSRAAMQAQLQQYAAALEDYTTVIEFSPTAAAYVSRAIVYQGLGTQPGDALGEMAVVDSAYDKAIADFDQAIALEPGEAHYYLWRGVAYHAINRVAEAQADYEQALAITNDQQLTAQGQSQAWTGLGWIVYSAQEYETAVDYFQNAADSLQPNNTIQDPQESDTSAFPLTDDNLTAPLLGLGYTYYSLRQYDAALDTWHQAADAATNTNQAQPNPAISISLGTLYWRVGTLGENYEAAGSNRCVNPNLSEAAKLEDAANLEASLQAFNEAVAIPGQQNSDVAFTYRTMGQVYYLLADCPTYDKITELQSAVDSYSQAIDLAPDNALYWHIRGRIDYVIWQNMPTGSGVVAREYLFDGLADQEQALQLDAEPTGDYQPLYWQDVLYTEAVDGTLRRGDSFYATGDYETALAYYTLVAERMPDLAPPAFKAGLATAALGDIDTAVSWYTDGVARAQTSDDAAAIQAAATDLRQLLQTETAVPVAPLLDVLQNSGVDLYQAPQTAPAAFDLALLAVEASNWTEAAELYEQGLVLAAQAESLTAVRTAAIDLQTYLLAHPEVAVTAVYWPLWYQSAPPPAWDTLAQPDLYWRYRAEFGFRFSVQLFKERRGDEAIYSQIYDQIMTDIQLAYAGNPAAHQVWRDFFIDDNIGWLYLRRGDDAATAQAYEWALADYLEATARILPNSDNARADLADALFKVGLTALQLQQYDTAVTYYNRGLTLTKQYALTDALDTAVQSLEALIATDPTLARMGNVILKTLQAAQ